jgi:hypothetical protein
MVLSISARSLLPRLPERPYSLSIVPFRYENVLKGHFPIGHDRVYNTPLEDALGPACIQSTKKDMKIS